MCKWLIELVEYFRFSSHLNNTINVELLIYRQNGVLRVVLATGDVNLQLGA